MGRYDDIDPGDIDPETGAPYAGYSSPALDTTFHDIEMDVDDEPASVAETALRGLLNALEANAHPDEILALAEAARRTLDGASVYGRPHYDEDGEAICSNRRGHSWVCRDDDEEISYCEWCGADGNG